jgi:hypothetical protein
MATWLAAAFFQSTMWWIAPKLNTESYAPSGASIRSILFGNGKPKEGTA